MSNEKSLVLENIQARGLQAMKFVNTLPAGQKIGVEETRDIIKLYYKACEAAESQGINVITAVLTFVAPLAAAYTGVGTVPVEISELGDDEITSLVNEGDYFQLGLNAVKFKQGAKALLVGVQTFFVFKK